MKQVSIYDFRENLASYIDELIKYNNKLVLKKYDKPVAMLVPYEEAKTKLYEEILALKGFLKDVIPDKDGVAYVNRIRYSKAERNRAKYLRNAQKSK